MKELSFEKMGRIDGGNENQAALAGFFCTATVFLTFSVVFAPIAGATAVGCAGFLYGAFR
jgi:hypothetical protein